MSTLAVKVERILEVNPHPNADRLDLVKVLDWSCVAGKDQFKPGDLCVYLPIDSLLPDDLEEHLFAGAKVKLNNHRVKTIKLRGAISQGMVTSLPSIAQFLKEPDFVHINEGADVTQTLGVKKYEPPETSGVMSTKGNQKPTRLKNPHFHKYTDIENAKNYPGVFKDGEEVVITEKIHGTNFRAGYVPFHATTLWKRIKQFFGFAPKYEFVYGSRTVQLHDRPGGGKTWLQSHDRTDKNVYLEAVEKYNLRDMLSAGQVVYGEIYGDGIQKGYTYGCKPGERKLVIFDIMQDGEYLDYYDFCKAVTACYLPEVPLLFKGQYSRATVDQLIAGPSRLAPEQKVREGVVVKPIYESKHSLIGRKVLKFINPEYLLKDQTDFH